MLSCNFGRVYLRRNDMRFMVSRLYQDILSPGTCEDVQRGLRNGAMSQQTLPVFITDTLKSQPPAGIASGCSSTACKVRNGSALAMDSQGNALTVEPQTQQASADSTKSTSSSKGSAYVKSSAYNGKSKQHKQFSKILRANLASEAAAVKMFATQSRAGSQRPDLPYFQVSVPLQSNTAV